MRTKSEWEALCKSQERTIAHLEAKVERLTMALTDVTETFTHTADYNFVQLDALQNARTALKEE